MTLEIEAAGSACCLEPVFSEPVVLLFFFFDPLSHSWSSVVNATAWPSGMDALPSIQTWRSQVTQTGPDEGVCPLDRRGSRCSAGTMKEQKGIKEAGMK